MPYVDDDLHIMIETLTDAGNALRAALAKVAVVVADSITLENWDSAITGQDVSEETRVLLVKAGKDLRDLAQDWVREEIEPDIKSELEEGIELWGYVQPLPEDVPGRTAEEGGPAYY